MKTDSTPSDGGRVRSLLPLLIWLVPFVALAAWAYVPGWVEQQSLESLTPRTVVAGERSSDYRTSVVATVRSSPEMDVRSSTAGVVTRVFVAVGDTPSSGDRLIAVNGHVVLAQVGGEPFFRELRLGDTGRDVAQLNAFLARTDFDTNARSETFSSETEAAVRSLQGKIGVPRDGIFRIDYVAYVPADMVGVSRVLVSVGATVSSGESIVRGSLPLVSVSIAPSESSQSLAPLDDLPRELLVGAATVPVAGTELDASEVRAFQSALRDSGLPLEPSDDPQVRVARGLYLRAASPVTSATVPGSALLVGGDLACLVLVDGDALDVVPLEEAPRASTEIGQVLVESEFVGADVVSDASALADDVKAQCE